MLVNVWVWLRLWAVCWSLVLFWQKIRSSIFEIFTGGPLRFLEALQSLWYSIFRATHAKRETRLFTGDWQYVLSVRGEAWDSHDILFLESSTGLWALGRLWAAMTSNDLSSTLHLVCLGGKSRMDSVQWADLLWVGHRGCLLERGSRPSWAVD